MITANVIVNQEFELRIDATCHNIIEENEFLIVEFVTHA